MNIKYYITTIFIISSLDLFSQNLIEGQIIDSKSKQPLAWVNIGIAGKSIGTVSNNEGNFKMEINDKYNQDTIRISMIGYKERLFKFIDFKNKIRENPLFKLEAEVMQLNEVIISNNNKQEHILGNKEFTNNTVYGFQSN
ncbi:carboxypeptidase-like regulatory domain-containing protein [Pontimicrobium aquaticum]|uniref:Carboxypeptidase-like regulatory domain-containing protein n=1 Tax=Pontimicrobium aquaticum TaxID=2565367 RepID=A0A4U0F4P3_9FLAO|nr:carboxypeptidase-like regulatory domain-containing protein [Pontimicrobium aquaticum]TJY37772.1 carboxypeptidase-like regulatory domain-containing protein [Pontimicrobium aquaticum]